MIRLELAIYLFNEMCSHGHINRPKSCIYTCRSKFSGLISRQPSESEVGELRNQLYGHHTKSKRDI